MTQQAMQKVSAAAMTLGSQYGYTPEYVSLIKNTIAKDATDDELQLFLSVCHNARLNPMNKEIHFWKQGGKVIIHTGIDGHRKSAERTGKYAPGKPVKREYDANGKLVSSTAYVNKLVAGKWFEIEETALWSDWSRDTPQWKGQYGPHQLDITAERHALKKAFPQLAAMDSTETLGDPSGQYGEHARVETPEDAERKVHLIDCLLSVGKLFCTPDQFNTLEATITTSPLAILEERHANALTKLREHVLSEIGKAFQGDEYSQFIVAAFPNSIEGAGCKELFEVLDRLQEPVTATAPAPTVAEAEPLSAEESELIDLRNEIMETISVRADGHLDKIDEILDGRALGNMNKAQLEKFKESLNSAAPF